jgi:hypothetical protein
MLTISQSKVINILRPGKCKYRYLHDCRCKHHASHCSHTSVELFLTLNSHPCCFCVIIYHPSALNFFYRPASYNDSQQSVTPRSSHDLIGCQKPGNSSEQEELGREETSNFQQRSSFCEAHEKRERESDEVEIDVRVISARKVATNA